MRDSCEVTVIGNLGATPELRYTNSSSAPVANLRVATSRQWKDKAGVLQKKTEWVRVVVFGKIAEACAEHLVKGQGVQIRGYLQTRSYQIKDSGTKQPLVDSTGKEVLGYQTEVVVNGANGTKVDFGNKPRAGEAIEEAPPTE